MRRRRRWFRRGSGGPDLACAEVVEIVTDYLEGAMSAPDMRRFEEHLAGCEGCTTYLEQMRTTIALTGRLREEDVPGPVMEQLVGAFRDWKAG